MTTEERLDRLTGMVEAQGKNIGDLTVVVNTLATSVVVHDNQIDALIKIAERHEIRLKEVTEAIANLEKQWQAYLNTLPRH